MRAFKALPVILLVALFSQSAIPCFGGALQRSRGPSQPYVMPDILGLQPESVRSILLIYLARTVSKTKAAQLENDVKKKPDDIDDRLTLIGYYTWNGQTAADRQHLRTHVLWMIENHPEHPATAEPAVRDLPDDVEGNEAIRTLWDKNVETHPDDVAVLRNAEKYYFGKDPAQAEQILRRLARKEPANKQWPVELTKLYTTFGVPGHESEDPAEQAREAYQNVLELTLDRVSRETLAGDMADSAFKSVHYSAAAAYAKLDLQSSDPAAIQRANTLLGRVALRSGDVSGAKQYLLDSARPTASRRISVFGPTMVLARELLERGERDAVLQYLEACLTIWPRGESMLQLWIDDMKNGRTPDFGALGN